MLQLDPPLPLDTPRGKGMAHFVHDPGLEHYLQFTVFLDETGECRVFRNCDVRLQVNETMGRGANPVFQSSVMKPNPPDP